jgi:hypothetical protein
VNAVRPAEAAGYGFIRSADPGRARVRGCRVGGGSTVTVGAGHALGWLRDQLAVGRRERFPGLRVAVDMSWALRPVDIAAWFVLLGAADIPGLSVVSAHDQ